MIDSNNLSRKSHDGIPEFVIVRIVQYGTLIVWVFQISNILPDFNVTKEIALNIYLKFKNLTLYHFHQKDKSCYPFLLIDDPIVGLQDSQVQSISCSDIEQPYHFDLHHQLHQNK